MPPADWPAWVFWIIGAAAVVTALGVLIRSAVKTGRFVKWAAAWVEEVVTGAITNVAVTAIREHTLSPHQVMDIVTEVVEAKVAPIHAEIKPNGGSSLKDQITRMEKQDGELSQLLHEHIRESALDRADLRHWLERIDPGRLSARTHGPPDGGLSY